MLKKDLVIELDRARDALGDVRSELRQAKELNKELRDKNSDLKEHKKSTEKALCAIEALIAVNCVELNTYNQNLEHYHRQEKELPKRPHDPLYDALDHVRYSLSVPVRATIRGY